MRIRGRLITENFVCERPMKISPVESVLSCHPLDSLLKARTLHLTKKFCLLAKLPARLGNGLKPNFVSSPSMGTYNQETVRCRAVESLSKVLWAEGRLFECACTA